jgi:hypothetical protein
MTCLPRTPPLPLNPSSRISMRWPLGTDGRVLCQIFEAFGYRDAIRRSQREEWPEWTFVKRFTYCDRHDCLIDDRRDLGALRSELEKIGATLVVQ